MHAAPTRTHVTETTVNPTPRFTFTRHSRAIALGALLALAALVAPRAEAAPCAGFNDVEDTSSFCEAVEWMRNRAITLGCDANAYCPSNAVNRLAMAAFMKRLGDALTPVRLAVAEAPGAVDLDAGIVACQTGDYAVSGFPRTAYADASFSAGAFANVSFAADLVVSNDGGTSWSALHPTPNRGSVTGGFWSTLADIGARELAVGDTVRFAIRLSRGGSSGTTDLGDSSCQLRVLVHSRTGTATPFDVSAAGPGRR